MKIQLSGIGCMALLLMAAIAGGQRTQAQPTNPLPIDVRLRTVMVQGVLWADDWGPNPGRDDGPTIPFPVEVVPIVVPNCAPLPCPDFALGTNTVTLGPGGFFTMPIVIPEELLANAGAAALKFAIRTNGSGEFTTLSGTMPLTAAPYASVALSVLGPIPASSLTGQMPTGMLTGIFSSPLTLLNQANVFAGDGSQLANVKATSIDLRGETAIRVAGAGVASRGPVFIHRATAGTISGHITTIDHPLANGDPNAILLVTHNYSADTSATKYEPNPVGVWYDGSRWTIYHENTSVAMPAGRAFNVMIIKP